MAFGIGGDGDVEVGDAAQARDQVGAIGEAVRVRLVARGAGRRIAAQRDDVADAFVPVAARDVEHLATRARRRRSGAARR